MWKKSERLLQCFCEGVIVFVAADGLEDSSTMENSYLLLELVSILIAFFFVSLNWWW